MVMPEPVLLGEALAHLRAQHPRPGGQIHLQQIVIKLRFQPAAMGRQQGDGGVVGTAQR